MGMSASQARLLSITARMNDVEFKSQSISNTKIRLADESEEVSKAYTEALNKQKLTYTDYSQMNGGSPTVVTLNSDEMSKTPYKLYKADGTEFTGSYNEYDLYEMIESGEFYLVKCEAQSDITGFESDVDYYTYDSTTHTYVLNTDSFDANKTYYTFDKDARTSVSGDNLLGIGTVDNVTLAKAEADYNAATSRINRKEKLLDNELKALDTEHSALKTEQDAIKSLISDNVDKTFNIFS